MKHYYSVQAFADRDIPFPEYLVLVGKGANVFTLTTEDISETLAEFGRAGVKIVSAHQLSGLGTFSELPTGVLFPGESPSEEANLRALGTVLPEAR